mgnify:CR=1 FL=1
MQWTDRQQKAIDERGENLLVAAAAGSGKTAVLVERIRKLIISDNIGADRMLVLTFTKAAASEMREKIFKSLLEAGLDDQLELLPRAHIGTFDSFALEVVKKYYHLIDLDPGISIGDETRLEIIKQDALDELFETHFKAADKAFIDFLDSYGAVTDSRAVREMILDMHSFLMPLPEPFSYVPLDTGEDYALRLLEFAKETALLRLELVKAGLTRSRDMLKEAGLSKLASKGDIDISIIDDYNEFASGTLVRHIEMDINQYGKSSAKAPGDNSIYHFVNKKLFNPILPIKIVENRLDVDKTNIENHNNIIIALGCNSRLNNNDNIKDSNNAKIYSLDVFNNYFIINVIDEIFLFSINLS